MDLNSTARLSGGRADFLKVIESASAGATHFEHTYRWLMPDGRVKHVHAIAHALQDASGNREFVGAATDITQSKRAEKRFGSRKQSSVKCWTSRPNTLPYLDPLVNVSMPTALRSITSALVLDEWLQTPRRASSPLVHSS